jgi:hypothetical protein
MDHHQLLHEGLKDLNETAHDLRQYKTPLAMMPETKQRIPQCHA